MAFLVVGAFIVTYSSLNIMLGYFPLVFADFRTFFLSEVFSVREQTIVSSSAEVAL